MKKVVVITGGIGSGKSEVCRILSGLGYKDQYDADSRVKALYIKSDSLLPDLETALGIPLRDEKGVFQPLLLAQRIFTDKKALEKVEEIVFPALLRDFEDFVQSCDSDVVIFESATVLEKEFFSGFGDAIILVNAPYDVRLARAMCRDNASEEAVRSRMNNQRMMNAFSDFESIVPDNQWYGTFQRIDAVVDTDCPIDQTKIRVQNAMNIVLTKMFSM